MKITESTAAYVVALAIILDSIRVDAQAWEGLVAGDKLAISGSRAPTTTGQHQSFRVYIGGIREPINLGCGLLQVRPSGAVLFCSDDLNKYQHVTVDASNYFNFLFVASKMDYFCRATTQNSPLFCRIKSVAENVYSKQDYKIPNK